MLPDISLKPLHEETLPRLVELTVKPEVNRWLPFPDDFSLANAEQMLAVVRDKGNDYYSWMLHSDEQFYAIGAVTMMTVWHPACVQIGFWIDPAHQRKGYASAAVDTMCKLAFMQFDAVRVQAQVQPENKGSIAVLEKQGFTNEGLMPASHLLKGAYVDTFLYAKTRQAG